MRRALACCLSIGFLFWGACGTSLAQVPVKKSSARPGSGLSTLPVVEKVGLATLKRILAADSGNVVLLNAWASWCKPCAEEMPGLLKIHRSARGKQKAGHLLGAGLAPACPRVQEQALRRVDARPFENPPVCPGETPPSDPPLHRRLRRSRNEGAPRAQEVRRGLYDLHHERQQRGRLHFGIERRVVRRASRDVLLRPAGQSRRDESRRADLQPI